jgi:hypothetical protein
MELIWKGSTNNRVYYNSRKLSELELIKMYLCKWMSSIRPVLGKVKQEHGEFKASLNYTASSRPA